MPDIFIPARFAVSGLYVRREWVFSPPSSFRPMVADTVRLDVDGSFPLMRASGLFYPHGPNAISGPVHWISDALDEVAGGVWESTIHRRFPEPQFPQPSLLPHDRVRIQAVGSGPSVSPRKMTLTFTGGAPDVTKTLEFESPYFRAAEFEFDVVENAHRVTEIDTWAHPEHANIPREMLSIAEVYSRAGVDLQQSPNTSVVPLEIGPGAELWDDQQLHDAMRRFWSRYQPRQPWAGWVLFAHRHRDPDINGIMFDHGDVKPKDGIQRQGAAVFGHALADKLPSAENLALWFPRRIFFTAIHEIGHCFNLGHSWEKHLAHPWIFLGPDPGALSIMNRPEDVPSFWQNFKYRFSDQELYFVRHAPEEFVEMGAAAWGENHGDRIAFQRRMGVCNLSLALELGVSRARRLFQFLEPITLELKLTNKSIHSQFIDRTVLNELRGFTLVVVPCGGLAKEWRPYAKRCCFPDMQLLQPGESLSRSLFASAGVGGWYLAEPGSYTLHARLETPAGDIFAEPLTIRIASPRGWDEEYLAQDLFTDEVGRALAFGGTHVMNGAIEALHEAADRLKEQAVALHAILALALPLMRNTRALRLPEGEAPMSSVAADGGRFEVIKARPDEARGMLHRALLSDGGKAVETFGYLAHQRYTEMFASWLRQCGDAAGAAEASVKSPHAPDAPLGKGSGSARKGRRGGAVR